MRNYLALLVATMLGWQTYAQITPNGNSGATTTSYTNGTPNDPIFIWCSDVLATAQGSLTATPSSGVGPFTFRWFYHDQNTSSWVLFNTQSGATSTVNNLASDGYRVQIRDAGNNLVDCAVAWVWNMNTEVVASQNTTNCNQTALSSTVNTTGTFTYFNPPPPESLISATTQIQVCFSGTHTFVSDLGFFLVGPAACGSPTITLSPNPGANGQGSICNSGDNINNLCFTSVVGANFDPCASPAPYTGLYSSYGVSPGTQINWSSLIGCNAASGGWRVQIYDCIGADVGALTSAAITFSNLTSVCGSPTSITYNSGAISSVINDNSCSAASASIFQVPVSTTLSTPIVLNATTALLWTANPATAITNATMGSASATSTGNTDYILTATTSFAGVSCPADDTAFVSLTMPVVSAGQDQSSCSGGSITLSGSGAVSYSWDNGVMNGVSFIPGSTLTYTVTGTDANGCTGTDQVIVSVAAAPTINAGIDQAVCPGTSVSLSGSGGVSYSWNSGINDGVSFVPGSTQTYTVTGTDAVGCTNTDQVTVTVNTLPTVSAGLDQAVCNGGPVILTGSGSATSYSWTNGISNGVSFVPTVSGSYTVTGTDANGCVNTDQVSVTVNPLPTISAGLDQAVCVGQSATLTGSGGVSYSWNNSVTNGVSFVPASTATYTVTGTDGNGCVNTDQLILTVNPLPVIDAGVDQTICLGTQVTLSGTGAVSYTWTSGVSNGQAFTPGLGSNTYTVTGTDANGCTNTDQVLVNVVPVPIADINSAGPLSGYPGISVSFTNNSSLATTYVFDYDNGLTTNTTNVSTVGQSTFTVPGTYEVILTASNGICSDQDMITVIVIPFEPLSYEIPNVFTPNGDNVNDFFEFNVVNGLELNVVIVNRWGNMMYEINGLTDKWDGTVKGKPADDGVYFYKYTLKGKDGSEVTGQGFVQLFQE